MLKVEDNIGRNRWPIRVRNKQKLSTILCLMGEDEDNLGTLATLAKDFLPKCWNKRTRRINDENLDGFLLSVYSDQSVLCWFEDVR